MSHIAKVYLLFVSVKKVPYSKLLEKLSLNIKLNDTNIST